MASIDELNLLPDDIDADAVGEFSRSDSPRPQSLDDGEEQPPQLGNDTRADSSIPSGLGENDKKRHRSWFITIHPVATLTPAELAKWIEDVPTILNPVHSSVKTIMTTVYVHERGGEENRDHLHVYVRYSPLVNWDAVVKDFTLRNCAHPWVMYTLKDFSVLKYIDKRDKTFVSGVYQYGVIPKVGASSEFEKAVAIVSTTGSLVGVDPRQKALHGRGLRELALDFPVDNHRKVNVITVFGRREVGKSRQLQLFFNRENFFPPMVGPTGVWWSGYNTQRVVVLDEYHGQVPLTTLKIMLDGSRMDINVHGGSVHARWDTIFVMSNLDDEGKANPLTKWYRNLFSNMTWPPVQDRLSDEAGSLIRRLFYGTPNFIVIPDEGTIESQQDLLQHKYAECFAYCGMTKDGSTIFPNFSEIPPERRIEALYTPPPTKVPKLN